MSHGLYPPLDLPPVGPSQLRRGLKIQTRYFCADSAPASQATVVRHWTTRNGTWVRCSYGKTLNGKSILKTMPADALALAEPKELS